MLHDHESVGSAFAAGVRPETQVTLGGPGFIPAEPCGAYLLAGDHTAVPAIAHIVENMPAGSTIRAVIEVPDRAEEQAFGGFAADVIWLHRPAGTPSRLPEAVRDLWPPADQDLMVWAGAEATIARAIRRHARTARSIPAGRIASSMPVSSPAIVSMATMRLTTTLATTSSTVSSAYV